MKNKNQAIDDLLQQAQIEVNYKYGKTTAGSNLSAAQAQQVLDKLDTSDFRVKNLILQNFRDGYVITSNNGREMSGFARTPKEAMAATWIVMCSLRKMTSEGKHNEI